MSRLYKEPQRQLQDRFETRALADRIEAATVHTEIGPDDKEFIESRDLFFLSTVDPDGRPTVSYKGGDPGFVRAIDAATLVFPSYDGNGMFLSVGNLSAQAEVGLLFIDFERPHRVRVQGRARMAFDDPLLAEIPGAQLIVRVEVSEIFMNCPRYIHRYQRVENSASVPRTGEKTPVADWKRLELMRDVIPKADLPAIDEAGPISLEEYAATVKRD